MTQETVESKKEILIQEMNEQLRELGVLQLLSLKKLVEQYVSDNHYVPDSFNRVVQVSLNEAGEVVKTESLGFAYEQEAYKKVFDTPEELEKCSKVPEVKTTQVYKKPSRKEHLFNTAQGLLFTLNEKQVEQVIDFIENLKFEF